MSRLGWIDLPRLRLWARPLRAGAVVRYALGRPGQRGGLRAPDPASRTSRGLEIRSWTASAPRWTSSGGGRRRATAAISSVTPSTSTGGIWTRPATTGASARSVGKSSWESQSSDIRSSTASRPGSSRTSSPRPPALRRYGCCCAPSTRYEGVQTHSCFFHAVAGTPPRVAASRVLPHEHEAAFHRQAAPRRCASRRARGGVALHAW